MKHKDLTKNINLKNYIHKKKCRIIFNSVFSGGAFTFLLNISHQSPVLVIDTTKKIVSDNGVSLHLIIAGELKSLGIFNFNELFAGNIKEIEINHLVWSSDISEWLDYIVNVIKKYKLYCTIYIHDYYSLCPTINLLNDNNKYCNLPSNSSCNTCLASYQSNMRNDAIKSLVNYMEYIHLGDIRNWRFFWENLFDVANKIIFPSLSAMNLWKKTYSSNHEKLVVMHHNLDYICKIKRRSSLHSINLSFYNVFIVGDVVIQKGSRVVKELLKILELNKLPICLNILGGYESNESLDTPHLKLHGRYDHRDIAKILNSIDVKCFLMLSIWPETFSYTTHEMMATGVPIISFNVGAQAEFISAYKNGIIIPSGFNALDVFHAIKELYYNDRIETAKAIIKNDCYVKDLIFRHDKLMVNYSSLQKKCLNTNNDFLLKRLIKKFYKFLSQFKKKKMDHYDKNKM
jgi:hypothetical protein